MTKARKRTFWKILFLLYLFLLAYLLFFNAAYGRFSGEAIQYNKVNLIAGGTISRYYMAMEAGDISFWVFFTNIIGNILIFIPFCPLFYMATGGHFKHFYLSFLYILIPFAIEFIQYKYGLGVFDIDDIALNAAGFFIGWVLVVNAKALKNGTDKSLKKQI